MRIFINIAILVTPLFYLVPNSYLVASNMGWEEPRSPGDPLDGYWYHNSEGAPGCIEELTVYQIKNRNFHYIYQGLTGEVDIKAVKGKELHIQMKLEPGVVEKHFVKDLGQELRLYRIDYVTNGVRSSEERDEPLFSTCDNPTTKGILLSLMSRVFDPTKAINKVTASTIVDPRGQ